METEKREKIRQSVRESYGRIARREQAGCGMGSGSSCCGAPSVDPEKLSKLMGYSREDLTGVPEGANLGLGCGNPVAIASMKEGETVVDLGSGGGFDCFLAARQVGDTGHVIGVDMTPEMVSRARANAERSGTGNVEFRLGEIENLPVADETADVVISNCVINLSPDKEAVYGEVFRVLKPGGRLSISDILARQPLPEKIREDMALVSACIGGAATVEETRGMLQRTGFVDIRIAEKDVDRKAVKGLDLSCVSGFKDRILSAGIEAVKPL